MGSTPCWLEWHTYWWNGKTHSVTQRTSMGYGMSRGKGCQCWFPGDTMQVTSVLGMLMFLLVIEFLLLLPWESLESVMCQGSHSQVKAAYLNKLSFGIYYPVQCLGERNNHIFKSELVWPYHMAQNRTLTEWNWILLINIPKQYAFLCDCGTVIW